MKKILLMLFALMFIGGQASATKVYATWGTPANEGKWDADTETYSWTKGYSNLATIFETPNGSLAQYKSIHLTTSNYVEESPYRICLMKGSDALVQIVFYSEGQKEIVFSERDETKNLDLSEITHISFGGASDSGSITVQNVYLQKPTSLTFDDAGEAEISFSDLTATGCFTFDEKTGVLTSVSTTGWGELKVNIPEDAPWDLSNALTLTVELGDGDQEIINNLTIKNADGDPIDGKGSFYSSKYGVTFNDDYRARSSKITTITWAAPYEATKDGTLTIKSIKISSNMLYAAKAGETVLTELPYYELKSDGTASEITATWDMGKKASTYYGHYSGWNNYYADLTDYSELRVYRDSKETFRLFLRNEDGLDKNGVIVMIDDSYWNEEEKYYAIDIAKLPTYEGKVYLIAVKSQYGGTDGSAINNIVVYNTPAPGSPQYSITGSGVLSSSARKALADETITLIDATGLTGTDVELESANPNCIFVANEGALANESNVLIGGTIENLSLTDGYPVAVPEGATATAATYTRDSAKKFGTICLPYEATARESEKFYTIKEIAEEDNKLVLEEVEGGKLPAGTPAIVVKESGTDLTITGAGALAGVVEATEKLQLVGTFAPKTILAEGNENAIYAISNNVFVKANVSIKLPAFRAYFTADDLTADSAPAKLRLVVGGDDATAIDAVAGEGSAEVVGIYSANGAEQKSLQKGVNIIKMSDGKVQKVLVK